jgi:CRISPR/Cas system-associated protein Cas5 (RAMP superfamily)
MTDEEWKDQLVKEIKNELNEMREYIDKKTIRTRNLKQEVMMQLDNLIIRMRQVKEYRYNGQYGPNTDVQRFVDRLDDVYRVLILFPDAQGRLANLAWDVKNLASDASYVHTDSKTGEKRASHQDVIPFANDMARIGELMQEWAKEEYQKLGRME